MASTSTSDHTSPHDDVPGLQTTTSDTCGGVTPRADELNEEMTSPFTMTSQQDNDFSSCNMTSSSSRATDFIRDADDADAQTTMDTSDETLAEIVVMVQDADAEDEREWQQRLGGGDADAESQRTSLASPSASAASLVDDDTLDALQAAQRVQPGLFVSGWEVDDEGVGEKDMMDPGEQVLTAAETGDVAELTRLLADRPDLVSVRDSDLYTPLHRAAYNNHADVVRVLLAAGADAHARTESGWTPLHCAACWGSFDAATLLIQLAQADVNACTSGHLTPLHLAVACTDDPAGATSTARLLLAQTGVDTTLVTGAGETAKQIAHRTGKGVARLFHC